MDTARNIWNWGLDEARNLQYDMHVETAWDAEDAVDFLDEDRRSYYHELRWLGVDETYDLQEALYGDHVLCLCGCGTLPSSDGYEAWEYDYNRSHLDWLYGV